MQCAMSVCLLMLLTAYVSRDDVCCVCECYKGGIVVMYYLYYLRKGVLFVLSWARVRRESISSELLMCGGGVRSMLFLPLVAG